MGLRNQLTQMDRHSQASHRILDHAPFSIMLMNSTREVLYANRWAKVINDRNDGLSLKHGRLSTATTDGTNRIRDMLESLSQPDRKANSPPELMAVERSSGEKPYQLMILPIQNAEEAGISTGPVYGVFVYDQKDRLPVDTSALKSLEGLTDSEAKLCESLYRTKSLAETAAQLQVSASTAKTHLLNTFRKLGINSQSELMRYLAHMPKLSSNQIQ
jgi:DNA-binding CsgD family transcriptional regulator